MLKLALDAAMPLIIHQRENRAQGLVCEFGVGSGKSLRMTQEILPLNIEIVSLNVKDRDKEKHTVHVRNQIQYTDSR